MISYEQITNYYYKLNEFNYFYFLYILKKNHLYISNKNPGYIAVTGAYSKRNVSH